MSLSKINDINIAKVVEDKGKIISKNMPEFIELVRQSYETMQNFNKIPQNKPLQEDLAKMLETDTKISDDTLNTFTMLCQITNTLHEPIKDFFSATVSDKKFLKQLMQFLGYLKGKENYIQTGGDPDDDNIEEYYTSSQGNQLDFPRQQKPSIVFNCILMLLGLVASLLFSMNAMSATTVSIQSNFDEFVSKLENISNRIPSVEEETITAIREQYKDTEDSYINDLSRFVTGKNIKDYVETQIVPSTESPKQTIEQEIQTMKRFSLPTMKKGEQLKLMFGQLPKEYIQESTDGLINAVTDKVVPVLTKIIKSAAKEGIKRSAKTRFSGSYTIQATNAITSMLGYGSFLPSTDVAFQRGVETFTNRMQGSINEITSLLQESTYDIYDSVNTDIRGYSAFAFAAISMSILQAAIIGVRMAKTVAQRNAILNTAERLLIMFNSPIVGLLMSAQRTLGTMGDRIANGDDENLMIEDQFGGRRKKSHKKPYKKSGKKTQKKGGMRYKKKGKKHKKSGGKSHKKSGKKSHKKSGRKSHKK